MHRSGRHVLDGSVAQLLVADLRHGTRKVHFPLRSVAHHDYLVEQFRITCQHHVYDRATVHGDGLCLHSHEAELEVSIRGVLIV